MCIMHVWVRRVSMLPIICTAGGSPPISSCPRQSVLQQNTEPQLLLSIRSMTRPLICCNNPSPQLSQHFTRNCHINSSGSQGKVHNNRHSSKMVAACSLHNESAAATLLTVTQISYMPQIFSALIRKQVETLHRNLFVRDLKRFM